MFLNKFKKKEVSHVCFCTSKNLKLLYSNKKKVIVGLALGSGSAKGYAHIGIIRALEQHGIYPSVISGTSMGALIGGAYAADKLDLIESFVKSITWKDCVSFGNLGFLKRDSSGIINGDKIVNKLLKITDSSGQKIDYMIENLPKKFGCIATDIRTGKEIWMNSGPLVTAVRASAAMPGIFSPIQFWPPNSHQQIYLVDGGLVNPVPVTLCRALGADVVIAVNLQKYIVPNISREDKEDSKSFENNFLKNIVAPLPKKIQETASSVTEYLSKTTVSFSRSTKKLSEVSSEPPPENVPHIISVIVSSINIMQHRITTSKMAGDPPDVELAPRMRIESFDFDKAGIGIEDGFRCVEQNLLSIQEAIKVFE